MPHDHAVEALRQEAARLTQHAHTIRRAHPRNATYAEQRATSYQLAAGWLQRQDTTVTTTLTTVKREIDRDYQGRPYVIGLDGKRTTYRRCTKYISVLADRFKLEKWDQRNVAIGLADRPDYLLSVAAHRDDKDKLDKLCDQAREAAKSSQASTIGTAVHELSHQLDRGDPLPVLPPAVVADLDAYRQATAGIKWLAIECGVVVDDLKVHGTFDRLGRLPDGRVVIADIKTGSITFGMDEIEMQLAMYAHGVLYDHITGTRTPLPDGVNLERAVVIHLPAGEGRCELVDVDIAKGWRGVQIAKQVWEWRGLKHTGTPLVTVEPAPATPEPIEPADGPDDHVDLFGLIDMAATRDDLVALRKTFRPIWTHEHDQAAKARVQVFIAKAQAAA